MTTEQRKHLDALLDKFSSDGKMSELNSHAQAELIFELGLALGRDEKKKHKLFKRPTGHPGGCTCEVCFAPVYDVSKSM